MRLFCFGDSNTYGYDPRDVFGGRYAAADRWPDLLAMEARLDVVNLGTNGAQIPAQYQPIPAPNDSTVDTLLIMLGTNDLLQGADPKETAARMEAFLCRAKPLWKNILLIVPPPMKRGAWVPTEALVAESIALGDEYRLVAQRLDIPFVDSRNWNIDLCFDGVHFSEAGHHAFAKNLGKELRL